MLKYVAQVWDEIGYSTCQSCLFTMVVKFQLMTFTRTLRVLRYNLIYVAWLIMHCRECTLNLPGMVCSRTILFYSLLNFCLSSEKSSEINCGFPYLLQVFSSSGSVFSEVLMYIKVIEVSLISSNALQRSRILISK